MVSVRHRIRRLTAAMVVGCVLLCSGCQPDTGKDAHFNLPLSGEPRQLDPQVSADAPSREVTMALFEGLTRIGKDGAIQPAAAEKWEISKDGCTYTFTLRNNIWSDGEPVRAADFVYGFRRAADPVTGSPLATRLQNIAGAPAVISGKKAPATLGVTATDDNTLVIRLQKADEQFLQMLATPPFFPCRQDFFESCKGRYGLETEYVLGNGPFVLSSWKHGTSLYLKRNEQYADVAAICPASVRFRIGEEVDGLTALQKGTLDIAPLPDAAAVMAATQNGMTVLSNPDTLYALWFNCEHSVLQQAAVRTALRDAVEWDTIYEELNPATHQSADGYITPCGVLPDGSVYRRAENAHIPTLSSKAEQRLKAALGDTPCPSLTLLCAETDLTIAQDILQSWQKHLKVYFQLETVPKEQLSARLKAGNYQMVLGNMTAVDATALSVLESFGKDADSGNYARFADATFEKQLAATKKAPTRKNLEMLEKRLYDTAPCVPIAYVNTAYGVRKTVSGLTTHAFAGGRFGTRFDFFSACKRED